jgi:hypothetical protein
MVSGLPHSHFTTKRIDVAQTSKSAVSRASKPAPATTFHPSADLEIGGTAGLETCATGGVDSIANVEEPFWGARASRLPLSASGRKQSPRNAVGGTPTAATGTVALPNPKRKVAHGKFMGSFFKSLFADKLQT